MAASSAFSMTASGTVVSVNFLILRLRLTASKKSMLIEPQFYPKDLDYRNLLWAITSPPLIPDSEARPPPLDRSQAKEILIKLSDFLSHKPRSPRLGVYFENLVEFYLRHILQTPKLYAHEKTENGEIDFIFMDPMSGRYKHWEVALKFYFYEPENGLYWGITRKDRFDIKTDRILNRQLGYSNDKVLLQKMAIDPSLIDQEILYKGRLFYPYGDPQQKENWYVRGWDEFLRLKAHYSDSRFRILTRREWLADPVEFPHQWNELSAPDTFPLALGIQRPDGLVEHAFILESSPTRSHD